MLNSAAGMDGEEVGLGARHYGVFPKPCGIDSS